MSNTTFVLTRKQLELEYFHYYADHTGAEIWIALFGVTVLVGLILTLQYKARFMYILPICGAIEVVGYITRLQSAINPTLAPFVVSTLSILLAPIFLALINYTTVGLLIESTGKKVGCINPSAISYLFFASDFMGLIIQGIGGSVLASAKTQTAFDLGANIILAGLAVQIFFFTIFTYMMIQSAFAKGFDLYSRHELKKVYQVLFVTTGLIYVRNVFRFIEFASGHTSYIQTHEWCFFTFESAPMFLVCMFYCIWHFGQMLPDEYVMPSATSNKIVTPISTSESQADMLENGEPVDSVEMVDVQKV
jgi:hypothetical protein